MFPFLFLLCAQKKNENVARLSEASSFSLAEKKYRSRQKKSKENIH